MANGYHMDSANQKHIGNILTLLLQVCTTTNFPTKNEFDCLKK